MKLFVVVAHAHILPHPTADCKSMCRVLKRLLNNNMLTFNQFLEENRKGRSTEELIAKRTDIRNRSKELTLALQDLTRTTDAMRFAKIPLQRLIPLIKGRDETIQRLGQRGRRLSLALDAIGPRIVKSKGQTWKNLPPDESL